MSYETLITPEELLPQIDGQDWVIVDCRFWLDDTEKGRRDYKESHIPGATYAHLDEDLSGPVVPGVTGRHPLPSVDELAAKLASWGISNGMQIVVYDDRSGAIASRLWWLLKWLGHDAVAVLDGGWPRWISEEHPTTEDIPAPKKVKFEPKVRHEMVVSAGEILTHFGDTAFKLIDSRAPERYRGEEEIIDPVAGHIPGAINYHFERNLDIEGNFALTEFLKGRFHVILEGTPVENTTFYCGSGVTAAHNILAFAHAGLGMPRLYAGSWSHWITDPERPITTGKS
ncbi:MAG: sulfurtransferase [Anaerolineales bacterium]|nr:sulfurtransferase [Chloroflexota bacterium]MBL6983960.1 sulfurtransferase [Anaerolineales bacterium]